MRYFPLFADLRGRRVLIVGGGEVAGRKLHLLREAGATVTLVAPRLDPALQELVESARDDGVCWRAGEFEESQLDGVVLAVAATDDAGVNARVAESGRRRNLLVNVVDDAGLSGFIVPAIVDRSPLVVAVSTGGAAPVLARAVRERIETLLDESFGGLATLAERWRARIRAALPSVAARRRFYERLLQGPVAAAVRRGRVEEAELRLGTLLASPAVEEGGRVTLVGAGPGDPGLLTLRGLRALQEADVILHDRLVSDEVLALARRDSLRVPVGKEGGAHSTPQRRIHELLLEHARAGRRVVRLKGGDPFVFGRGGEELEFLRAHGVDYEVVPGITAATACGAFAGIPLTHRDYAQSLRFVTAHCDGHEDGVDWPSLAAHRQTLVFYMGGSRIARVGERLVQGGRSPDTPVAVVEHGSRPGQRVTLARLDQLADLQAEGGIGSPSLLIVGEVAALGADLHWFGEPPRVWRGRDADRRVCAAA